MTAVELAHRADCSIRTVSRAISAGIAASLLERTSFGWANTHASRSSAYRFPAHATAGAGLTAKVGSACTRPASPSQSHRSLPPHSGSDRPQGKTFSKRYREYLSSPEWLDVIERYKQTRRFGCHFSPDRAGCSGAIQLHHVTYERVFHESLDDLVALCRRHHRELHHHFDSERQQDSSASLRDFSLRWISAMADLQNQKAYPHATV